MGLLSYERIATYGTFDELQRLPPVTDKDIQGEKIYNVDCKSPHHIRQIMWHVIQHWRKADEHLTLCVSGGWVVWSHFVHRLVHDDFAKRRTEDFSRVIDMDTLEQAKEFENYNKLFNEVDRATSILVPSQNGIVGTDRALG